MKRRTFLSSAMAAALLAKNGIAMADEIQDSGVERIPRVSNAVTMRGKMLYRDRFHIGFFYLGTRFQLLTRQE
jgi:hypothetical protein